MWVARYLFVGAVHFAVLAFIAAWAMGETIERAEIKLMPMAAAPAKRTATYWEPPSEKFAAAWDELLNTYGEEGLRMILKQNAVRTGLIKITDEG